VTDHHAHGALIQVFEQADRTLSHAGLRRMLSHGGRRGETEQSIR
jgi:hypothetical protein